ncbi:Protein of unknown function, partial [Gryllus bimaculatus]
DFFLRDRTALRTRAVWRRLRDLAASDFEKFCDLLLRLKSEACIMASRRCWVPNCKNAKAKLAIKTSIWVSRIRETKYCRISMQASSKNPCT